MSDKALAQVDAEPALQRVNAFCAAHTECARGLEYCGECQRTFCLECRRSGDARAAHEGHRTMSLEFALETADARFSDARAAIAQVAECLQRRAEDQRLAAEQDARHVEALIAATDVWYERAVARLGALKELVVAAVQKPHDVDPSDAPAASPLLSHAAPAVWSAVEAQTRRETLETLVRSAAADSNVALAKQQEASRMGEELTRWAQVAAKRRFDQRVMPVSAEAYLSARLNRCLEHVDAAERDLSAQLKEVRFWKRIEQAGLTESRVIPRDRLVSSEDSQELTVLGLAPGRSSDVLYFADSNNRKIKLLNLKTLQFTEEFEVDKGCLGGLFGPIDMDGEHYYVAIESARASKKKEKVDAPSEKRVLVLRADQDHLVAVQRVELPEKSVSPETSFAALPNGNLVCAVWQHRSLFELVRATASDPNANPKCPREPFEATVSVRTLPEKALAICGSSVAGEWRLAVSFADSSVRLFEWTAQNAPREVARLHRALDHWSPSFLAALPSTSALIVANGRLVDGRWVTALELFTAEGSTANGTQSLGSPRRLLSSESGVLLWGQLQFVRSNAGDGRLRLFAFDVVSHSLRVFDIS